MIALKNASMEAGVDPNGACLTHFTHRGVDILRPRMAALSDPLQAACFACVPYFGRIKSGIIKDGHHWPLTPTHRGGDPDHALHGEGWIRPWEITRHSDTHLTGTLACEGARPGRYPFDWSARQQICLTPDGLKITLALTSHHQRPAPFGLALHPFFIRAASTRVKFSYQKVRTPPGHNDICLDNHRFATASPLPDFTIDHSFLGWGGTVTISGEGPDIQLISDATYLHIYMPAGEAYFCVEPITQLPGAFGEMPIAEHLLLKGEQTRSLSMEIKLC